jgi:hypothetical protein
MKMLVIAVVLQASSPTAGESVPADQAAAPAAVAPAANERMSCQYDRVTRSRLCVNAQGEHLRCRREEVLGSRMPITLCTTLAEDLSMERESRDALEKYQNITTPDQH